MKKLLYLVIFLAVVYCAVRFYHDGYIDCAEPVFRFFFQ